MRTRNRSKRQLPSTGEDDMFMELAQGPSAAERGTLTNTSRKGVSKLLKRAGSRGSHGLKNNDIRNFDSIDESESASKGKEKEVRLASDEWNTLEVEGSSGHAKLETSSLLKVDEGSLQQAKPDLEDVMDDSDWEDGSNPNWNARNDHPDHINKGVTIDFDASPGTAKRKIVNRVSAEEKELAELVHRVHLLCLLGRGRFIDTACNDPLLKASLLSLLPEHFLKISEVTNLTANDLVPLVNWFHNNFHVRSSSSTDRSVGLALARALETHEGTPEEVAALSVALFRALNLVTRFVSILDAAPLKPDAGKSKSIYQDTSVAGKGLFDSSTVMVARPNEAFVCSVKESLPNDLENAAFLDKSSACETNSKGSHKRKSKNSDQSALLCHDKDPPIRDQLLEKGVDLSGCEAQIASSKGSKRKGDLEFEMQMEMALSATAAGALESNPDTVVKDLHSTSLNISPFKRLKKIKCEESSSCSQGISTAVGSKKIGAPLYWAEIYCSGENLTGKWVHVDAVNAVVDGEQKVEAAAMACKTSLRYVVAFAGQGAKDVTRRYCAKWYKIAPQRVDSTWWDAVLTPLKELESGATGGVVQLNHEASTKHSSIGSNKLFNQLAPDSPSETVRLSGKSNANLTRENIVKVKELSSIYSSCVATRSSLEDMELETRALTEPLPTNQQAYRNHPLYALEKWLTKYQILHPKGPILGFCSGHSVYPRTCVQMLHTKERWLREGLQLKVNELPVKVLNRSVKLSKVKFPEADEDDESGCVGPGATINLYGKWQTEPLCLPHAVNGIVPKNERGQVDVWSEKCLPPGTVHLGLPRVFAIAKRLEIDYAPAMVGFEFRNGRSFPLYNGIVVCSEFKDAILEAYAEEEERRRAEERRKNEAQAISRWYQLLSSIITRQRLNNRYKEGGSPSQSISNLQKPDEKCQERISTGNEELQHPVPHQTNEHDSHQPDASSPQVYAEDHEHVFSADDQSFDEETSTRTKRCRCGFSIQVEEL